MVLDSALLSVVVALATTTNTPASVPQQENTAVVANTRYIINDDKNVALNVPFIHQIENLPEDKKTLIGTTACGPASLTMAFNYLGLNISLWDVIDKLPDTVYVKGRQFYNLPSGAELFDLKTVSFKNSPKNIYEALKNGHPVILNIQNYDGITGHAVVVTGIKGFDGEKAEGLIVNDPYGGSDREFKYLSDSSLEQPEGYINYIGILDPFYVVSE
jgi:hypothetical protein